MFVCVQKEQMFSVNYQKVLGGGRGGGGGGLGEGSTWVPKPITANG